MRKIVNFDLLGNVPENLIMMLSVLSQSLNLLEMNLRVLSNSLIGPLTNFAISSADYRVRVRSYLSQSYLSTRD